jgi:uncharacterized protein (DUF427 family)
MERLEEKVVDLPHMTPPRDEIVWEQWPRRVRAMFGGETVADSTRVMLMIEGRRIAVYYFPVDDVHTDLLVSSAHRQSSDTKGEATFWSVRVGERLAENAARRYLQPPPRCPDIAGYVTFSWEYMDAWFEEDDEVFIHPRSPYHRVDVLNSSRHVRVMLGGTVVADTTRPRLLFETSLPTRYYIPKLDVRMDLLRPSETTTGCPYKGRASYWHAEIGGRTLEDIAWCYSTPIPECPKIENLVAFFNERVDAIEVDGEIQPVPETPWSRSR